MNKEIEINPPFQQKTSERIYIETYKWETDKNVYDTFRRVAKHIASIEKDKEQWEEKYYELLSSFRYVPAGRILSNAGTNLKGTTYINCFVSGFTSKDPDSITGIYTELGRQAKILKSEGGYGCNFDVLRPRGAFIEGIGVETPGTIEIMSLWDTSSSVITAGSKIKKDKNKQKGKNKIRKGAMMGTLSCWHPAVEEFITAKQDTGKLERFNLSVLITDDFMHAVKNHQTWSLIFPDTKDPNYDNWDGDIKKWIDNNGHVKVYKTYKDANELWDLIIDSTYNRNEPGVIFIDRYNELNNLYYCETINCTNPCGEQGLPVGGSCNLGAINLTQYLDLETKQFDLNKLKKDIPTILRFQDAVIDLTNYPLPEQEEEAQNKRRVGIGYMGYGSSLYMLKIPYGSKKALDLTEDLCQTVANELYRASANLAQEKGVFKLYDETLYAQSKFVRMALNDYTIRQIKAKGLRNSHILTIAPTGNTSIFSNNVSGGLEPVFDPQQIRTVNESNPPDELELPINIDWVKHTYEVENGWRWILEGDEWILHKTLNETTYKIYEGRGLTREESVFDYSLFNMEDYNPDADYVKTVTNLSIKEHVDTMKVFAKYIDSSISKTINIPNDYSKEDFQSVYMDAYDSGVIKGVTTYRIGTMAAVIYSANDKNKKEVLPNRPKSLPCHVYRITVHGEKWIVFVGLHEGEPYEVFTGKVGLVDLPSNIKEGSLIKLKEGKQNIYQFENNGEILIKDITKLFETGAQEALTRQISLNLRSGTHIDDVIEQLNKSYGTIVDFNKSIIRALKRYMREKETGEKCQTCGSPLIYLEGCATCPTCNFSKCG